MSAVLVNAFTTAVGNNHIIVVDSTDAEGIDEAKALVL